MLGDRREGKAGPGTGQALDFIRGGMLQQCLLPHTQSRLFQIGPFTILYHYFEERQGASRLGTSQV